jgi:lysozyme
MNRTLGIDISKWQGNIDWDLVTKDPQNVKFAICRTGDGSIIDKTFEKNITEAYKKELIVGSYHFFRFRNNIKDVLTQAEATCDMLLKAVGNPLPPGILPPTLDVEEGGQNLSEEERTDQLLSCLEKMKELTNLTPILYTFPSYWNSLFKKTGNQFTQYFPWIAHVNSKIENPTKINGFSDWLIWQFSHTGKIQGIKGNVDLNWWNGSLTDVRWFARLEK